MLLYYTILTLVRISCTLIAILDCTFNTKITFHKPKPCSTIIYALVFFQYFRFSLKFKLIFLILLKLHISSMNLKMSRIIHNRRWSKEYRYYLCFNIPFHRYLYINCPRGQDFISYFLN